MMLSLALGLLVIAAILGLVMVIAFFQKRSLSIGTAIVHGMFTEAAVVLVFVKAYDMHFRGLLGVDLLLMALAAIGGLSLVLLFHLRDNRLPAGMVMGHASLGVIAFLLLLVKVAKGV